MLKSARVTQGLSTPPKPSSYIFCLLFLDMLVKVWGIYVFHILDMSDAKNLVHHFGRKQIALEES